MHLRGKNIIKPGVYRAHQNSTAKLTHLPDVLLDIPAGRGTEILSYLDAKENTRARANLSMSCVTLYQQTERARQKRALEQLLQAMLDHYPLKVSSILKSYPELLLAKPEAHNIREIESRFTWLRYLTAGESVFSIAQKLLLVDMLKIMLPHYLKQLEDASHVPDDKHVLELEKQWILPKTLTSLEEKKIKETQKVLQEKYTQEHLWAPLTALAADTTIQVNWWKRNPETKRSETEITHISPAAVKALEDFRKKLFEPKAIKDCIDINQLLIAAYHVYDSHFDTFQNWHQRNGFAILVIGFIQSLVNPSLGKACCEHLYGVTYHCQKISPRADSLRLTNGHSFYRESRDSQVGLGFHFLCGIFGGGHNTAAGPRWRPEGAAAAGPELLQDYVTKMYRDVLWPYAAIAPAPQIESRISVIITV